MDLLKIKEIDGNVKNKFNVKWLERNIDIVLGKENVTVRLGDEFVKNDLPGQILCKLCSKQINYGSRGVVAMDDHIKSAKHLGLLKDKRSTYNVVTMLKQLHQDVPVPTTANTTPAIVPMCDRVSNAEAAVLGVIAQHSMPLSMAPVLVNLAKTLSEDKKALAELSMDRTTASYKLNHGLATGFQQKLVNKLQKSPFSLNLDEATSKSNKKVLTILVSFYDLESERVVIEHLTSTEIVKTNAQTIYDAVCDVLESNNIPWTNLVSVLMDSCNVMRGHKSGVETRIREMKAPHLLNIDGESCHHMHNASKKLCAPFSNYLENLFNDLHWDFKYSQDLVCL